MSNNLISIIIDNKEFIVVPSSKIIWDMDARHFLYFSEIETVTLTCSPFANIELYKKVLNKYNKLIAFL